MDARTLRTLKQQAHKAVTNALDAGVLERPERCARCYRRDTVEGHHRSYEPQHHLAVIWLCLECHRVEHGKAASGTPMLSIARATLPVFNLASAGAGSGPDRGRRPSGRSGRTVLTARQAGILSLIIQGVELNGFPPTVREIGAICGIRSTNGVMDHLEAIERKGYIERADLKSRGMRVLRHPDGTPYQRAA